MQEQLPADKRYVYDNMYMCYLVHIEQCSLTYTIAPGLGEGDVWSGG